MLDARKAYLSWQPPGVVRQGGQPADSPPSPLLVLATACKLRILLRLLQCLQFGWENEKANYKNCISVAVWAAVLTA